MAQATKQGWLYLFDRTNGKPLFPIEYRRYTASDVPGEVAADTQPLPAKPAPFARQQLTEDLLTTRTPEAHAGALEQFRKLRGGGQFVPLTVGQETVVFPGFDGGAEWGGQAFDPETGIFYVNANDLAWTGESGRDQAPATPPADLPDELRQLSRRQSRRRASANSGARPPEWPKDRDGDRRHHAPGRGTHAVVPQFERRRRNCRSAISYLSGENKELADPGRSQRRPLSLHRLPRACSTPTDIRPSNRHGEH